MCGIAGKIYFGSGTVNAEDLQKMSDLISHRGPDDEGLFVSDDKNVGLVSRRLAILDLSSRGHQPMRMKGRYWIVFNGEIYNFQQEAKKLEKMGYKFHSRSDTEVILALYDKYGVGCLEHLRGMFAFAIYDTRKGVVFLARDRMGKKPLKYFFDGKTLIFASELKAILGQKEVKRKVDWVAIHHYLTLGYCPSPFTGFEKIYKLDPASYLWIDLEKGTCEKTKYWTIDFSKKEKRSEQEWKDMVLTELEESTKLRMIADVPVGAFLSGGVDSSAVVALMARNSRIPVKTFTIGFDDPNEDERGYAKVISKLFGTEHMELVVNPQSLEILPDLARQYEEPFADNSAVVTYLISKLASQFVKVVLNGDGSDESFCGYLRHNKIQRDVLLGRLSPAITRFDSRGIWKKADRFAKRQAVNISERYVEYNCYFTRAEKKDLYRDSNKWLYLENSTYDLWQQRADASGVRDVRDQMLYTDLTYYFPDSQLVKVDIATMASGLEARSPFSDHKMMELAASMPYEMKIKNGVNKYILKKSLEGLVPKQNLYRPKKGFTIPLVRWFTGELNDYCRSRLSDSGSIVRELFKRDQVLGMLKGHNLTTDFGPKLWNLLMLELWYREYFDQ